MSKGSMENRVERLESQVNGEGLEGEMDPGRSPILPMFVSVACQYCVREIR